MSREAAAFQMESTVNVQLLGETSNHGASKNEIVCSLLLFSKSGIEYCFVAGDCHGFGQHTTLETPLKGGRLVMTLLVVFIR